MQLRHHNCGEAIAVIDLARMSYAHAYRVQIEHLERLVASRDSATPTPGVILLVEHEPVITVTPRPGAAGHVLASSSVLADAGVDVVHTDRGGDVTYHGPGQLVVYPIIDLNAHALRIIDYIRLLEAAILDALATFGIQAHTDPAATGVWVRSVGQPGAALGQPAPDDAADFSDAKIAAIGVRVRQWVSMHGLSINVDPDMAHFDLLVPCGLHGRPVTSMARLLGARGPTMDSMKSAVVGALRARLDERFRGRVPSAASPRLPG